MLIALRMTLIAVSALIMVFVGLAFLPHWLGARLTTIQKFLTAEIRRRGGAA